MFNLTEIVKTNETIDEQMLIKYLEGKLSDLERFEVEKQIIDSAFVSDAVDGLKQFNQPNQLNELKTQLNKQLKKEISKKSKRKKMRKLQDQPWLVVAIFSILFLCIMGFLLIHFYLK